MKQKQFSKAIFSLFFSIILIGFASCFVQKKKEKGSVKVKLLTDSIISPYMYFSEIKVTPTNTVLLKNIQNISENKNINSINPEERLKKKIALYKLCRKGSISFEKYTPEGYKIITNKNNILTIEYSYNEFSNPDEYFKYAAFDLINGERITYNEMFKSPSNILNDYNNRYTSEIKSYLKKLDRNDAEELEEYNIFKVHLETRNTFLLEDLNNLEIVYDAVKEKVTQLKFHYNGHGGVYKQYFQQGSIDFNIEKLKPYLTEAFKKQLGI